MTQKPAQQISSLRVPAGAGIWSQPSRGRQHELGDDQVRRQLRLAVAGLRSILTSITTVLRPTCSGSATATISSPSRPAAKTLSFSSIVVKSCPGGMLRKVAQAATVSPSAVQTPPWTKPPGCRWRLVDDDPAAGVRVLDLQRLDPEIAGEAAAEEAAGVLGGDRRARMRSSLIVARTLAEPEALEAVVAEGLVALSHRLAEAGLGGAADEGVALLGVAGDAVEEGPERLRLAQALRVERSG